MATLTETQISTASQQSASEHSSAQPTHNAHHTHHAHHALNYNFSDLSPIAQYFVSLDDHTNVIQRYTKPYITDQCKEWIIDILFRQGDFTYNTAPNTYNCIECKKNLQKKYYFQSAIHKAHKNKTQPRCKRCTMPIFKDEEKHFKTKQYSYIRFDNNGPGGPGTPHQENDNRIKLTKFRPIQHSNFVWYFKITQLMTGKDSVLDRLKQRNIKYTIIRKNKFTNIKLSEKTEN